MRISENIARLRKAAKNGGGGDSGRLSPLGAFGDNPGNLVGHIYIPEKIAKQAPLVVVLHGCTQTAAAYDQGSGWSKLADRHGFILLFPEQQRANNPNLCFNWYQASDTRRGAGEAASIHQMIAHLQASQPVDPAKIFVTGLSAGGAMTSVMLAAYPEVFAGGAIIAGIAYGCAGSVGEAFECMGGGGKTPAATLGDHVRQASPHEGPWPRVSVWHGSADRVVNANNGEDIVKQWLNVHGLPAKPQRISKVEGYPHRVWTGKDGQPLVEQYVITGMAHGTPLAPGEAVGQSGRAGPHMLDAAISSTDRIAAFWGIAGAVAAPSAKKSEPKPAQTGKVPAKVLRPEPIRAKVLHPEPVEKPEVAAAAGVQKVIENALRAAGLMR